MSTLKRWQTPASLSLVLAAAIILVLAVGYRADTQPPSRAALASTPTTSAPAQCPSATPVAAPVATAAPVSPPAPPAAPSNVGNAAPLSIGSGNDILSVVGSNNQTQGSDGGFGDIGMQFQNVNINAPITNVHISGTGNNTNVNVSNGDPAVTPPAPSTAPPASTPPAPSTTPTAPTAGGACDTRRTHVAGRLQPGDDAQRTCTDDAVIDHISRRFDRAKRELDNDADLPRSVDANFHRPVEGARANADPRPEDGSTAVDDRGVRARV